MSVQLPPRDAADASTKANQPPVWSVTRAAGADENQQNDVLHALCNKHDRPQGICCRELKGSDVSDNILGFLMFAALELKPHC